MLQKRLANSLCQMPCSHSFQTLHLRHASAYRAHPFAERKTRTAAITGRTRLISTIYLVKGAPFPCRQLTFSGDIPPSGRPSRPQCPPVGHLWDTPRLCNSKVKTAGNLAENAQIVAVVQKLFIFHPGWFAWIVHCQGTMNSQMAAYWPICEYFLLNCRWDGNNPQAALLPQSPLTASKFLSENRPEQSVKVSKMWPIVEKCSGLLPAFGETKPNSGQIKQTLW